MMSRSLVGPFLVSIVEQLLCEMTSGAETRSPAARASSPTCEAGWRKKRRKMEVSQGLMSMGGEERYGPYPPVPSIRNTARIYYTHD